LYWLLSFSLLFAHAKSSKPNLAKVGSCNTTGTKQVLVIKQWHLSPTTVTKGFKEKYPQEKNQSAIYLALAERIKKGKLQVILAEGCEGGEINSSFTPEFNGWGYTSLQRAALGKGYDKVLSHIPLKLEAKFESKILTLCGDNEALIKEGNMRLSNLRGWSGFWSRLNGTSGDDKVRLYADTAADTLKVDRATPVPDLLQKIKARMTDDLAAFKQSLTNRNASFVKVLQSQPFEAAAVVIGGLHADDLKEKLEAAGLGCEVLEPPGYRREDEQLLQVFTQVLTK
jgi:hypothetical protein